MRLPSDHFLHAKSFGKESPMQVVTGGDTVDKQSFDLIRQEEEQYSASR